MLTDTVSGQWYLRVDDDTEARGIVTVTRGHEREEVSVRALRLTVFALLAHNRCSVNIC